MLAGFVDFSLNTYLQLLIFFWFFFGVKCSSLTRKYFFKMKNIKKTSKLVRVVSVLTNEFTICATWILSIWKFWVLFKKKKLATSSQCGLWDLSITLFPVCDSQLIFEQKISSTKQHMDQLDLQNSSNIPFNVYCSIKKRISTT